MRNNMDYVLKFLIKNEEFLDSMDLIGLRVGKRRKSKGLRFGKRRESEMLYFENVEKAIEYAETNLDGRLVEFWFAETVNGKNISYNVEIFEYI